MVNALHDPATGHNHATNVARQFGDGAVLLTYEGWGHGIYFRSECTINTTDRYLIELVPPPAGFRCPAA
jgi:hypothetical protein